MIHSDEGELDVRQRPGAVDALPEPLEAALQFISMCNYAQRPVVLEDETQFRVIQVDMPIPQEQAFNLACRVAGKYFAEELKKRGWDERGTE